LLQWESVSRLKWQTLTKPVRISCIIPTRNRPEYLVEAANSVLSQSHSDLELIIVNDGLTPVPSFDDHRVRILNSGQAGAVPARNFGASHAKGDAIAWLDDDDVWTDPDFLKYCADVLTAKSDFVFGDGALVFPHGTRKAFARDANAATLERDNTILISAVCYRTALHATLGAFDEALPYYWDWDWYIRVVRANHVITRLQRPVVDIRIHAQNMSGEVNADKRADNLKAMCAKHNLPDIQLKSHVDFV
jgi:glycosyltransferase involved in cell wall biosynthesis